MEAQQGAEAGGAGGAGPDAPRVNLVILSLGSNLGDRVAHLERGLARLRAQVRLERISSIYETQPVGVRDQPWFLNLVCLGPTSLKPHALLEVEAAASRVRGQRFGPRTLDVDILAYEDQVIGQPELEIPHPRMSERAFVLEPLAEIAPEWRHPVEGRSAAELRAELVDDVVRLYASPPPLAGPAAPI